MTDYESMVAIIGDPRARTTIYVVHMVNAPVDRVDCTDFRLSQSRHPDLLKIQIHIAFKHTVVRIKVFDTEALPWPDDDMLLSELKQCVRRLLHSGEFEEVMEFIRRQKELESL